MTAGSLIISILAVTLVTGPFVVVKSIDAMSLAFSRYREFTSSICTNVNPRTRLSDQSSHLSNVVEVPSFFGKIMRVLLSS